MEPDDDNPMQMNRGHTYTIITDGIRFGVYKKHYIYTTDILIQIHISHNKWIKAKREKAGTVLKTFIGSILFYIYERQYTYKAAGAHLFPNHNVDKWCPLIKSHLMIRSEI